MDSQKKVSKIIITVDLMPKQIILLLFKITYTIIL
ncbi:MAG TPA: hypothetical protein [Caudoviricetes sp.]|nr:MAG TPA: hypothetical protein [Caudoviricetes sp.]